VKVSLSYPNLRIDGMPQLSSFVEAVLVAFRQIAGAINNPDFGSTAQRPPSTIVPGLSVGQSYFDTTLGKPVWWDGTHWVDATGASV
jgi:hypothetical protein